ncbi:MAG: monothiol glutaredoxin grx4 [Thelocarpon superellum]|nr:MAG: monothiol glutaredoxin grx4 [Thelocarpon superellum]
MASLEEVSQESDFRSRLEQAPPSTLIVIYFHTPWAAPCEQMRTILSTLASSYPASTASTPSSPIFLSLDAEDLPDVSESYDVSAVPFIALQKDGKVVESISGIDPARIRAAVERHGGSARADKAGSKTLPPPQTIAAPSTAIAPATNGGSGSGNAGPHPTTTEMSTSDAPAAVTATVPEDLHARLTSLVQAAPVMLFMKGTPSSPQCGFSRQLVGLLRERGVRYGFFNILADDEVRQGLKEFADWPTFPQLWVKGELVGGLDIVKEEAAADPAFLSEHAVKSNNAAVSENGAASTPNLPAQQTVTTA